MGKVVRLPKQPQVKAIFYDPVYKDICDFTGTVDLELLKWPLKFDENADTLPPNLLLTVGGPLAGIIETYFFAGLTVLLQIAVLVADGVKTYH